MVELNKKMTIELPKDLVDDFRKTVKESGYTQKFLISRIIREIIQELKDIKKAEDAKKQSL